MSMVQCLVVGINFFDPEGKRYIPGDLHQIADTLIVDASGCKWVPCSEESPMPADDMAVMSPFFYERNSQIVFPLAIAAFNAAANKFLTDGMDAESLNLPRIFTFDSRNKH
jgi:hypothetical protein